MIIFEKLRKKIHEIMTRSDRPNTAFYSLEIILKAAAKIYGAIILLRNKLYHNRIFKSHRLPCFVISVGNITIGGTGKTPMTCYLANCLQDWGLKTAVITRGYGGKLEKKGGVVSDGNRILAGPELAGDEPYMMAEIIKSPIIAGKNRYRSAQIAIDRFSAQVLILDDGFQHHRVKRNINLLLMDSKQPVGNGYILPRGTLREPVCGATRSDAVILTRCKTPIFPTAYKDILPHIRSKPQFKADHSPFLFKFHNQKGKDDNITNLSHIEGKHATIFSGIAGNSNFENTCKDVGMIIDRHLKFKDHHKYTQKDMQRIISDFINNESDIIATTHKDYAKIEAFCLDKVPIAVLDVTIKFEKNDEKIFHAHLKKQLNNYFENLQPGKQPLK